MRIRAAVAVVLTAATTLAGVSAFAGTASANNGSSEPRFNGLDIVSITPDPVRAGNKIKVFVEKHSSTGKFVPFTLTGPCIDDFFFDPGAYTYPGLFKASIAPTLVVKKNFSGKCTITIFGVGPDGPMSDTYTITVLGTNESDDDDDDDDNGGGSTSSTTATTKPTTSSKPTTTTRPRRSTTTTRRDDDDNDRGGPVGGSIPGGGSRNGSDFDGSAVPIVRSELLPAQQAAVAVEATAVVLGATPAGQTKVAGVSVTNAAATLPRTGSSSVAQAWLGAALAAIGGAFVLFARRRVRFARVRSTHGR